MQLQFIKMIQFSHLLKAGGRLREFNFRKFKGPDEELFSVNVSDERGDRILFMMQKKENGWKLVPGRFPQWILDNEKSLEGLIEDELSKNK